MKQRVLFSLIILTTSLLLNAQFYGPNAIAWNPNNSTYYITNTYGKNVVSLDPAGNKSVFISGLNSPNNIIYADLPALSGFLILDSNEVKAYDDAGAFYGSYSTTGAIKLQDIVYDTSLQAVFLSDVERGVIYKTTFGGPPFYFPNTTIFASPHRRPSAMLLQPDKNRLLFVEDTIGGNLMAVDLKTASVTQVKALGIDGLVGLAEDGEGNLYLSSQGNKAIYQLNRYYSGSPQKLYSEPKPADLYVNIEKDQWVYTCIICGTVFTPPIHLFGPGFEVSGCRGDTVVSYKHYLQKNHGTFNNGNYFYLELTSILNPLAKPVLLASIQDTLIPDSFRFNIPLSVSPGNYKQRWRSSSPPVTGTSELFTIFASPGARISVSDTVQGCKNALLDLGLLYNSTNTYQWSPPEAVDSPSAPLVHHLVQTQRKLYLKVVSADGCIALDSAVIKPVDNPRSNIDHDTVFACAGTVAQLGAKETGGLNYSWSPGLFLDDSTQSMPAYNGNADKWFYLRLTATGGCYSVDSQFVHFRPLPVFSVKYDTTRACPGSTGLNFAVHQLADYKAKWTDCRGFVSFGDSFEYGSDTQALYYLEMTDLNTGCSAEQTVYNNPFPADSVSISEASGMLRASRTLTQMRWYRNDTLYRLDSAQITATTSGFYRLCGMNENNCEICSPLKEVILSQQTGTADFKIAPTRIFPNPACDWLHIKTTGIAQNWQISDAIGKIVLSGSGEMADLHRLPQGTYLWFCENHDPVQFVIIR